jgi:hypothetical protein
MKQSTIYLLLLCFISCRDTQETQPASVAITVLNDITDPRQIQPNAEFPLALLGLDIHKENEVHFKITSTTDMVLNPSREVNLQSLIVTEKENVNDDPYYREKCVLSFYTQVKEAIKENIGGKERTNTYKHSECFRTICREIIELQKQKSAKSILIVYSDLQENSDIANVYGKKGIDTSSVKKAFTKTKQLPDSLNGLTVYFVFQPMDREEDKKFISIYALYEKLLLERGARVILQTNNKNVTL